jgi:hypothetical protein
MFKTRCLLIYRHTSGSKNQISFFLWKLMHIVVAFQSFSSSSLSFLFFLLILSCVCSSLHKIVYLLRSSKRRRRTDLDANRTSTNAHFNWMMHVVTFQSFYQAPWVSRSFCWFFHVFVAHCIQYSDLVTRMVWFDCVAVNIHSPL